MRTIEAVAAVVVVREGGSAPGKKIMGQILEAATPSEGIGQD